jgi:hypothetical protein
MSTEAIIKRIRNLSPAKLHRIETVLTAIERDPSDDGDSKGSSWLAGVDELHERLARKYGAMPDSVTTIRELRDNGPR